VLAGPMIDRLTMLLSDQAPQYCRPIRCSGNITAAVVASEAVPEDLDRCIELICDWAASGFKTAESTHVNQQLSHC
jgi:hypothetical protein